MITKIFIQTKDFFKYDLIQGLKNIFFFWKVIWNYRSWDYSYQLRIFARSLEPLADNLEKNGNEVEITRLKKVKQIQRAIEILNHQINDDYTSLAEKALGYSVNINYSFEDDLPPEIEKANREIFTLSDKIDTDEWAELFKILQGQNHTEFIMLCDKSNNKSQDLWDQWYDGSGMQHWWD